MKKIKITIDGMHCSSCANNVEKSLKKVPGVKEVSVSLMLKKGSVEYDDNEKISEEEIKKAVARAGYKAVKVELFYYG